MCNKQIKQSPNARKSNEASTTDARKASSINELFETPISVHGVTSAIDTISASEAQTMSKDNYYTPCWKDKRFLALLIETIFWAILSPTGKKLLLKPLGELVMWFAVFMLLAWGVKS